MDNLRTYLPPLGRLLLSSVFIWAGFGKLMSPGGTAQYFASLHIPVPNIAVWVVIIVELIGGLMLLIGLQTRWVALALAIFCLITGFTIHLPVGDVPNMINFYKNLAMTGGFLYVMAYGAGNLSIDGPSKVMA
jgi:putative oxidoreductase